MKANCSFVQGVKYNWPLQCSRIPRRDQTTRCEIGADQRSGFLSIRFIKLQSKLEMILVVFTFSNRNSIQLESCLPLDGRQLFYLVTMTAVP